jgi:hypothetical protein
MTVMIDPIGLCGVAVSAIGYYLMQISVKRKAFIASSLLSFAGLIISLVYTSGGIRYFLIGLSGVIAVFFIKRIYVWTQGH